MPRFLFPDKPVLDDSERTRTYTGMNVAGMEQGTSIGIGYIGESYVDFGPVKMFAPIFLLGLLYGLIYRFFVTKTRYTLLWKLHSPFHVWCSIALRSKLRTSSSSVASSQVRWSVL